MQLDAKTITQIEVEAPSNIAFVKYWGKTGLQHPINPSVSMTLKTCTTKCSIKYSVNSTGLNFQDFIFNGQPNKIFKKRIERYLQNLIDVCTLLKNISLTIKTENSFPHSAGIASSASAFGAIGFAIANIEHSVGLTKSKEINKRASELARLGSGSAARSIEGPYSVWGEFKDENSKNDYAQTLKNIHEAFYKVHNTILLIDPDQKSISSSAGHALMDKHHFKEARVRQAITNTKEVISSMREGDWEKFGDCIENEALSLHAMMMTSNPSYMLLAPNSILAINAIRRFRRENNIPVYFTIDAGPNIHVIYPEKSRFLIENFIKEELSQLCRDKRYITDECGKGARVVSQQ